METVDRERSERKVAGRKLGDIRPYTLSHYQSDSQLLVLRAPLS